jgi:hypothetical protein
MNIIDLLRNSNKELLKAEAEDISKWSKLKHNKEDLNLLLKFNIAEIEYKKTDNKSSSIVCTSNSVLIDTIHVKHKDLKKAKLKYNLKDVVPEKNNKLKTFDLIDKKIKTLPLTDWKIKNFISITPENILILHELLENILK